MPAVIRRSEMEKLSNLMDQYSNLQANEIDRYQFVNAMGFMSLDKKWSKKIREQFD